jgi:hypothetical protein
MERLCIKPGESDELNSLNINKLKTYLVKMPALAKSPNSIIKINIRAKLIPIYKNWQCCQKL